VHHRLEPGLPSTVTWWNRVERRFDLRSGLVVSLAAEYHLPAISLGLDVPQALLAIADRVDRMNFPCPPLADSVAKLPKCRCKTPKMPCGQFPANRLNEPKSQSDIASRPLPKAPASSSQYDVVPQMIIRSSNGPENLQSVMQKDFCNSIGTSRTWTCTTCGDRFETAYMSADAEPKMSEKDWEQMFPSLLVA